jgi:hypothetical protein
MPESGSTTVGAANVDSEAPQSNAARPRPVASDFMREG